jgi:5-methylcytosine-specific restriction endonuclease McrA
MDDFFNFGIDDDFIRAERNKARALRKTRWWQQTTASGTCHYCGQKVGIKKLTMDHIVPLSRGGRSTKGNLVPCCKKCNTDKKANLPSDLENL